MNMQYSRCHSTALVFGHVMAGCNAVEPLTNLVPSVAQAVPEVDNTAAVRAVA
jgi:hypothetical protein